MRSCVRPAKRPVDPRLDGARCGGRTVDAAFGGRGIGEKLLRTAASRAREKGAGYLRLSVDIDNTKAEAFYERLGISHSPSEHIHMIKGEAFHAFADKETTP